MNIEILLVIILTAITILAYMVAINSQGAAKLLISYLMATIILVGTVYCTIQLFNKWREEFQQTRYNQLQKEKLFAEQRINSQAEIIVNNRKKIEAATKINAFINKSIEYSSSLMNLDPKDFTVELHELVARADKIKAEISVLKKELDNITVEIALFPETKPTLASALSNLEESARYYWLYFRAEDSAQEELRARMLRQKASQSYTLFKKANTQIASSL